MFALLEDDRSPKAREGGFTHNTNGPKKKHYDCGHGGPMVGARHVARTHEEIQSAKVRDPDLSEGVSMRVPMGDQSQSIDDGAGY